MMRCPVCDPVTPDRPLSYGYSLALCREHLPPEPEPRRRPPRTPSEASRARIERAIGPLEEDKS